MPYVGPGCVKAKKPFSKSLTMSSIGIDPTPYTISAYCVVYRAAVSVGTVRRRWRKGHPVNGSKRMILGVWVGKVS